MLYTIGHDKFQIIVTIQLVTVFAMYCLQISICSYSLCLGDPLYAEEV